MEASDAAPLPGKCRDWKALRGPGVLVVDGWCTFPSAGWMTELRKAEPPSDDPKELLLERVTTVPEGYQPPVTRGIEVHFEEVTDVEYETVTILPDGLTLEVVDAR
ncbi:MAG TPA: hypothetical protein VGR11_03420 [Solirubrobacteraceae bacterium]|nr:hypothetical protein [Solirubrobacteraceae bacterium]